MAIDIKDLGKELLKIVKTAGHVVTMKKVAKKGKTLITERTQKGQQADGRSLPNLEKSTVSIRRKAKLAPTTSPEKSNVTRSGKLLKSINASGKSKEATIEFKSQESLRKMDELKSVKSRSGVKNFTKFFGLSKKEEQELIDEIESAVKDAADQFNKK